MGMEMFYNKTVTLFNRFCDPDTEEERYYPTILEHVNLVETKGANVSKSGMDGADAATLFLDLSKTEKPYIEPKEWAALPDVEKMNFITFTPAEDFFVKGSCTGATLPECGVYEWMRNNYDAVYKVKHVDRYCDIMPHLEVGGV